jgi:hypothetical protein
MKQILHIFAKDARHLLAEILISLAVLAAFVRVYPSLWLPEGTTFAVAGGSMLHALADSRVLALILSMFLPVTWWLLIARVIHAEALVGDRQFWITRPYEWQKLLGAKALFLVAFLYLPLLMAQCLLLHRAGFHPGSFITGLLLNLLLLSGMIFLPLVAITTVTSTFARLTVTLLALLAVFFGYIAISLVLFRSAGLPYNEHLSIPLSLLLCGAVVVVQYSTRRLRISLLLLIALPVLLLVTGLSLPEEERIARDYPAAGAPVHLALLQDADDPAQADLSPDTNVQIKIPLQVSGVPEGFAITPDHVKVTVDAGDGLRWTSPWQDINNEYYLPDTAASDLSVSILRPFFDRVQSKPVALQLTLAYSKLRAGDTRILPLSTHNFEVPRFGVCSAPSDYFGYASNLGCRFALHQPALTRVSVPWRDVPCSRPQPAASAVTGDAWVGSLATSFVDPGIPTVWNPAISLSNSTKEDGGKYTPRHLCPGVPVTFTAYHLVERTHGGFTLRDFHLPSYQHDEARHPAAPTPPRALPGL